MAFRSIRAALIVATSLAAYAAYPARAQTADTLNTLSPAEKHAGWTLLFDGVDKDAHWRVGEKGATNTWKVEDHALASADQGNELFTREAYSDFEFAFEWKLSKAGNSGAFFRVNPDVGRFCSSSEYAILDDENGDDRTALGHMPGQTMMPIKRTGACYDLYPTTTEGDNDSPYVAYAKPYDQWNRGVIWAEGKHIEHWLNGRKVVDYSVRSADWNARFQASKYPKDSRCAAQLDNWMGSTTGLLGLQDHGGGLLVWYRNLKVRPFTPGGKLSSPVAIPPAGKYSGATAVKLEAGITGAVIRYTLDGSEPGPASPIYSQPITLAKSATVKAKTFRDRFLASDAASAAYEIGTVALAPRPKRGKTLKRVFRYHRADGRKAAKG